MGTEEVGTEEVGTEEVPEGEAQGEASSASCAAPATYLIRSLVCRSGGSSCHQRRACWQMRKLRQGKLQRIIWQNEFFLLQPRPTWAPQ